MINDHFLEECYRLREMKRFTIRQVNRDTSPAEHSWFTGILGLYVSLNSISHKYDTLKVVTRCMLHDVPEAVTSDIPYFIKHHNKESERIFKCLESKIVGELYVDGMAEKAAGIIQDAILGCKDDTIEGKLVALCDLLEAMWYLTEERVRGNHNKWIDEVYQQLIEMITVSNNNLKEPLIDDIKDYLTKSFGTIVTVNWSDILGGGYDKGMSKEAHSRCNTRKHGATRIARQKKSRRRSRSTKNI